MREILFRGKTFDTGEWVEGYYFVDQRDIEDGIIWRDIPQIQQRYGDHFQYFDVIIETVGQYTGLTDKNGEKVFEGDIIKLPFCNNDIAVLEGGTPNYALKGLKSCYEIGSAKPESFEVIGNIYDNSDLLKEGAE